MDTETIIVYLIIGIMIIYVIYDLTECYENFEASNEAVQNIYSIYNKDDMKVTKLSTTDLTYINDLPIMKSWDGDPPKQSAKNAGIANDTDKFKKLMIVGNNSAGGGREVGIWDNLTVSNNLNAQTVRLGDYFFWINDNNLKIENTKTNKIFMIDKDGNIYAPGNLNIGSIRIGNYLLWENGGVFKIEKIGGNYYFGVDGNNKKTANVDW